MRYARPVVNSALVRLVMVGSMSVAFLSPALASAQEACFTRLDNGVDLTGWKVSTTNHHGPGAGWSAEGGALVGRQTGNALGGILMTNAIYTDVEVVLEVKLPWGCDSGLFFRTTGGDRAYQVTIDHLAESGVGGIYGESFSSDVRAIPYFLTNQGTTAVVAPGQTPIFDLAQWGTIWKPTEFNEIRARVEGNPPHIQVWIAGLRVANYTDTQVRGDVAPAGPIAIQVHGGAARWVPNATVQFRNIRVKDLTANCVDPGSGGAGGAGGAAGSAGSNGEAGAATAGGGASSGGAGGAVASGGAGAAPTAGANMAGATSTPPAEPDSSGCNCSLRTRGSSDAGLAALSLLALVVLRRVKRSE